MICEKRRRLFIQIELTGIVSWKQRAEDFSFLFFFFFHFPLSFVIAFKDDELATAFRNTTFPIFRCNFEVARLNETFEKLSETLLLDKSKILDEV